MWQPELDKADEHPNKSIIKSGFISSAYLCPYIIWRIFNNIDIINQEYFYADIIGIV